MNDIIIVNNEPVLRSRLIDYDLFFQLLEMALDSFYSSRDLKKGSVGNYKDGINYYINWLKNNKGKPICVPTLIEYRDYMANNLMPKTVNLYLSGLRSFFNFLEDLGQPNLARSIKNLKVGEDYTKNPLSADEFIIIENEVIKELEELEVLYKNGKVRYIEYLKALRNYAILYLAVSNMLREKEMYHADKIDIQVKHNRTVLKIKGKGYDDKSQFTVLADKTLKIINKYLKVRGQDSYTPLFINVASNYYGGRLSKTSISKILKKMFKKYGNIDTPLITAHSTRHTGATFLHIAKVDMRDIQEVIRHKNINTTAIYAHTLNRLIEPKEFVIQEFLDKERLRLNK